MAQSVRERLKLRLIHLSFLLTRPMSLGVRAIVVHPPTDRPSAGTGFILVRRFPDGSAGYVLDPAR